jgi:hypothetical protein
MSSETGCQKCSSGFRRGNFVTVRDLPDILRTLGPDSTLDGLPFMPEMTRYCGGTFRVHRRAEKTCVEGLGFRSMSDTVFLDGVRCDGASHDGCQRGCLIFWKEAWLREADGASKAGESAGGDQQEIATTLRTVKDDRYFCQSTELAGATAELRQGALQQCLHDVRVGELSIARFLHIVAIAITSRVRRLICGQDPRNMGGTQSKTPAGELGLKPGELVEVKSLAEIKATLNAEGMNRGLSFEAEMAQHCGRRYRVSAPVRTIIAEQTGKMVNITDTVILDDVVCDGLCSLNCPRANFFYWRELWLKRV